MQIISRKQLGAYYTPADLAQILADWAVTRGGQTILEPSVGGGALVRAVLQRFEETGSGSIVGCEIDSSVLKSTAEKFRGTPVVLCEGDFLSMSAADLGRFDAVVGNPPFTRNHRLHAEKRAELRARDEFRHILTGAPGLWVYFLVHSMQFVLPGGCLAFLTPGAIAFADYAAPLIEEFRKRFGHVEIDHVEGPIKWNGHAQERAALVLASDYGQGPADTVLRRAISLDETRPAQPEESVWSPMRAPTAFGLIAKLEIGVVTGANEVFLINRSIASVSEIPDDALRPIIARARHARGLTFKSEDALAMADEGQRTLLLYPAGLGPRGGPIRRYLAQVPKKRRLSVHWFSKRDPWWRVQMGRSCDAVFTYMNSAGPRLTLTGNGVTCTNTLHRVLFIDRNADRMRTACVSMLSTYTQLQAERIGRIYGGGVLKFELKDARRLPLLIPQRPISQAMFSRIDTSLKAGAAETARRIADEAVMPEFFGREWQEASIGMAVELAALRACRGVSRKQPKARS